MRFYTLCFSYVVFMSLFTAWSIAEAASDPEDRTVPRAWGIATLVSILPLLLAEMKQAWASGARRHFGSIWNVFSALVIIGSFIVVLLSEAEDAGTISVPLRVLIPQWKLCVLLCFCGSQFCKPVFELYLSSSFQFLIK